jgi:hypothetical protein
MVTVGSLFNIPERPIIVRSSEAAQRLNAGVKSYCAEVKSRRHKEGQVA